jgi:hypothetical protein
MHPEGRLFEPFGNPAAADDQREVRAVFGEVERHRRHVERDRRSDLDAGWPVGQLHRDARVIDVSSVPACNCPQPEPSSTFVLVLFA